MTDLAASFAAAETRAKLDSLLERAKVAEAFKVGPEVTAAELIAYERRAAELDRER